MPWVARTPTSGHSQVRTWASGLLTHRQFLRLTRLNVFGQFGYSD